MPKLVKKRDSLIKSLLAPIALSKAEFKARNEGSFIGVFWYLLNPLLLFILLYFIFFDRLGQDIPYYSLSILLGLVLFNFFQSVTMESTGLIRERGGLIKSIRGSREALPLSTLFRNLYTHIFEISLFFVFLLFIIGSVTHTLISILIYLLILPVFCIFLYGITLIFISLSAYFVDLGGIWNFSSRLLWLGTPIFYAIEEQTRLFYINLFNPMYYFITISRDLLIYRNFPEVWMVSGAIFYSLIVFLVGFLIFNKLKYKFAELI